MDKFGGAQSVSRFFTGQLALGDRPELVIDQGHELVEGFLPAAPPIVQKPGHLIGFCAHRFGSRVGQSVPP